jgi:hypothetical protein
MLNKWIAAYPKSAAARLSLAEFYISYGHFARSTGYANTVSIPMAAFQRTNGPRQANAS